MIQIRKLLLLMLLGSGAAYAAPTPEKQCYDRVQGKVAWNRKGKTKWDPKQVRRLCKGVRDVNSRIGCFQEGIRRHNEWKRAIKQCSAGPRTQEQRCFDRVQGQVAWNKYGNRKWNNEDVRRLCKNVTNIDSRINCFKRGIRQHNKWRRAVAQCTSSSAGTNPTTRPTTRPAPPAKTKQQQCYDRVQGKVAWDRAGRQKRWTTSTLNRFCKNVDNIERRVTCFNQGLRRHGEPKRAIDQCNGTIRQPQSIEENCYDRVQGNVARNRYGHTSWTPRDVKRLCKDVKNITSRISCFKKGIDRHGITNRAINECNFYASSKPPSKKDRCYFKVQNKVAWDRDGRETDWTDAAIDRLCNNVNHVDRRIGCFKERLQLHGRRDRAIAQCNGRIRQPQSKEENCYDRVQGNVAWHSNGDTRWEPKTVRRLCKGVTDNIDSRIKCFEKRLGHHNDTKQAIIDCNGTAPAQPETHEEFCQTYIQVSSTGGRNGSKPWTKADLERVCRNVKSSRERQNRVYCYQTKLRDYRDRDRAINECNGTIPPKRTREEQQCHDRLQGKVASYSGDESKFWFDRQLKKMCDGVKNVDPYISCVKKAIQRNNRWNTAADKCKATGIRPTSTKVKQPKLYQTNFRRNSNSSLRFHSNRATIGLSKMPKDADCSRYATLHDGKNLRLFCFKKNSRDTLYQFALNPTTQKFEYGYRSVPKPRITGTPKDANPQNIAMVHDGSRYHLYMLDDDGHAIYRFTYNPRSRSYEYDTEEGIAPVDIVPKDADPSNFAVSHDGTSTRLFLASRTNAKKVYPLETRRARATVRWNKSSIEVTGGLKVHPRFSMAHDGSHHRLINLK